MDSSDTRAETDEVDEKADESVVALADVAVAGCAVVEGRDPGGVDSGRSKTQLEINL